MPVEFLTDEQAAAYGRYDGCPSRADPEKFFFLDDEDKKLINRRRHGDANRLGFGLQLTTVRYLGTFLAHPLEVPDELVACLADQLGISDSSTLGTYTNRKKTRFEHLWEIQRELGLKEFASAETELEAWVDARAWTTGEGPKAIFDGAVAWLH